MDTTKLTFEFEVLGDVPPGMVHEYKFALRLALKGHIDKLTEDIDCESHPGAARDDTIRRELLNRLLKGMQ